MKGKEYVAVLLYAYPRIDEFIYDLSEGINIKARLSFRSFATAERLAEEMIGMIFVERELERLKSAMEKVFSDFSEEEKNLLDYKYFHQKKNLSKTHMGEKQTSERSYFRKQNALFQKICSRFLQAGLTEEWFSVSFGEYKPFQNALARLRRKSLSIEKRRKTA